MRHRKHRKTSDLAKKSEGTDCSRSKIDWGGPAITPIGPASELGVSTLSVAHLDR